MALVVKDRVQETSTTTGTGSLTLLGAVTGFQTFSSAIGNTNTTYYTIQNGAEWEVGVGTVSAGALSRDTVLESSNSGSLVDFSAGTKFVFCTYPAEKSVDIETAQTLTNKTLTNPTINGFTGDTSVINVGSGQIYKDTSGNVGIGTASPTTIVNIVKNQNAETTVNVINSNSGSSARSNLLFGNDISTTVSGLLQNSSTNTTLGGSNSLNIYQGAASPLVFLTSATERMRIDSSGNVGIGTSSPTQKLEVNGGGLFKTGTDDYIHLLSDSGAIEVVRSTGDAYIDLKNTTSDDYDCRIQSVGTTGIMGFSTVGTERMRIDADGVITSTLGGMQVISGTSQATTSGTSVTLSTSIPSWAKKITIMLNGVSMASTGDLNIQVGTGSTPTWVTSGYQSDGTRASTTVATSNSTTAFVIRVQGAASTLCGTMTLALQTGNTWSESHSFSLGANVAAFGGGAVNAGAAVTSVRISTSTGNFDAGAASIIYE